MTAGRVVRRAARLVLGGTLLTLTATTGWGAEVRVLSGPAAATTVTVTSVPDVAIEDRTPGAKPAAAPRGPASAGETFADELTLFLRGFTVSRSAAIDVADPVVSSVRLFPEPGGATLTIFVRQPVTYSVSRPSALGEVRIELRAKTRPVTVSGLTVRGRPRVVRPTPTGEREVAVDAESLSYDQQTNTLTARGSVTLTRGDTTLTADEVVYDRTNGVAEAHGHVVLSDPEATVEGESARLNLEDESGWIDSATADLHPSDYVVRAGRLEKKGGPQYSVANGVFTSCRCGGLERPSWSIGGARTDVNLRGIGTVRSAVLRVKDVPVFYFPYFIFPANNQRQSGFLIPRVGYSNRRGFQYEQPFFWAISKSTDATFALDVETAARIGGVGEYRYILSRQAHGAFTAAYYNEGIRGRTLGIRAAGNVPADIPENRFLFAGHHISPFYGGSKFYLDLFAISDNLFLREINNFAFSTGSDLALRSTRFTTSRTGVYKGWGEGLASVETAYYQDLIDPQELALQKLPRVEAEHSFPLLGDRLVARLAGQAINYQRDEGYDGLRADLTPGLFLPFHLGRVVNGSLAGQLRETAYHLTDTEQVVAVVPKETNIPTGFRTAPELPRLDANRTRELAEVQGRLGTEIARVFGFRHLGLEKLRHTFEPEVQYLYVPQVGRPIFDVQLPACHNPLVPGERVGVNCNATLLSEGYLFDERDAINRRSFLSYGFTTRLLGRAATGAEVAALPAAPADPEATSPPAAGADASDTGLPAELAPDFVGPPPPPAEERAAPKTPSPVPRELARASVLHGYDLSRSLVGDSHQSDIDFGLRLTPVDYLAMTYNTTVSAEERAVRGLSGGILLREPWWSPPSFRSYQSPTTASIGYHFIEKSVNQGVGVRPESGLLTSAGANELDGGLYVRLGNYLGFGFFSRFSFNEAPVVQKNGSVLVQNGEVQTIGPHFLERDYLVRVISRCNCWMIEAGVADKFNPDERLFRVQLTLVGLGSFGRPATRNFLGVAPLTGVGVGRPGVGPGFGGMY
ncbi:MAG TPA: LPS assembly protein LptD [Candidatus Binatus sp.]|nr:LPS assembly protein LptD [Candidatus Binatus sp.]